MADNRVYSSIAELVGNTPLVELTNYEREHGLKARVLAKLEYFNPSGSVKDRIALGMIEAAERELVALPPDLQAHFLHVAGMLEEGWPQKVGMPFTVQPAEPGICTFL